MSSNNTGELTALLEGLLYVERMAKWTNWTIGIFYDSEYAIRTVLGIYKANKNRILISKIQAVLRVLLGKQHRIFFEHIKSHEGHEGNEKADQLATLGHLGNW